MLAIITFVVTPFAQNMRLIIDEDSGQALAVDPGGEVERLVEAIAAADAVPAGVFLTHAHLDHGGGVAKLLDSLQARYGRRPPLLAHADGRILRATLAQQAMWFGLPRGSANNVPEPDTVISDGETVPLGDYRPTALFTPGHSPDHLALFFPACSYTLLGECSNPGNFQGPMLIAGDTLFAGSIARTDLPGGNHEQLLESIRNKLFGLPEETVVLSGHGPDTTIGRELRTNPYF